MLILELVVGRGAHNAGLLHDRAADFGRSRRAVGREPPHGIGRIPFAHLAAGAGHDGEGGVVQQRAAGFSIVEDHAQCVVARRFGAIKGNFDRIRGARLGDRVALLPLEHLAALGIECRPRDLAPGVIAQRGQEERCLAVLLVEREDVAGLLLPEGDLDGDLLQCDTEDVEGTVGVRVGLDGAVDLLEVLPTLAGELEIKVATRGDPVVVLAGGDVEHVADIERNGGQVERDILAALPDGTDLLVAFRDLAVAQVDHRVAKHVAARTVARVVADAYREDRILGLVRIKREDDVGLAVGGGGQTVVDGGGEAVRRGASVVLLDLERPVALALLADGHVGRVDRRGHGDRYTGEVLQPRLESGGGIGEGLGARVETKVDDREPLRIYLRQSVGLDEVLHALGEVEDDVGGQGAILAHQRVEVRTVEIDVDHAVGTAHEVHIQRMRRRARQPLPLAKDVDALRLHVVAGAVLVEIREHGLRAEALEVDRGVHEVGLSALGKSDHGHPRRVPVLDDADGVVRRGVSAILFRTLPIDGHRGDVGASEREAQARAGQGEDCYRLTAGADGPGSGNRLREALETGEVLLHGVVGQRAGGGDDDVGNREVPAARRQQVDAGEGVRKVDRADFNEAAVGGVIDVGLASVGLDGEALPVPVGHEGDRDAGDAVGGDPHLLRPALGGGEEQVEAGGHSGLGRLGGLVLRSLPGGLGGLGVEKAEAEMHVELVVGGQRDGIGEHLASGILLGVDGEVCAPRPDRIVVNIGADRAAYSGGLVVVVLEVFLEDDGTAGRRGENPRVPGNQGAANHSGFLVHEFFAGWACLSRDDD